MLRALGVAFKRSNRRRHDRRPFPFSFEWRLNERLRHMARLANVEMLTESGGGKFDL
jgi:hypothetical protein